MDAENEAVARSFPQARGRRIKLIVCSVLLFVVVLAGIIVAVAAPRGGSTNSSTSTSVEGPTMAPSLRGPTERPPVVDGEPASSADGTPAAANSTSSNEFPTPAPTVHFYEPNEDRLLPFLASFADEEFYMTNVLDYRDSAAYRDNRPTNLTGLEAYKIYSQFMTAKMLPMIGAKIEFLASIEIDAVGDSGDRYDTVETVRYPNGTVFQQMLSNPEYMEMVAHKEAGLYDSITLATQKIDADYPDTLEDPPYPPNDNDLPFAYVHLMQYKELAEYDEGDADANDTRTGREAVTMYSENAQTVAKPLGVVAACWFDVVSVISGPEIDWDEVRINTFPSHETFNILIANPVWQQGYHHRSAGMDKTYGFRSSPIEINDFNGVGPDFVPTVQQSNSTSGGEISSDECRICGDGNAMTNALATFSLPGLEDPVPCGGFDQAARSGAVPPERCDTIRVFASVCCSENLPQEPTDAPPAIAPGDSGQCFICGEGNTVSNTDAIVDIPGTGSLNCGSLEIGGLQGGIDSSSCGIISSMVAEICCSASAAPPPTGQPMQGPTPEGSSDSPTAYFYEGNSESAAALITEFADQEFYMVNVIQYRGMAVYEDGRPTDLTGAEANNIYGQFMSTEMLPSIGAEVMYSADVERDVTGPSGTQYDTVGIVRYPNGTVFGQMSRNPRFQEMLAHKEAGVYETIVLATKFVPLPPLDPPEDVPFPATAEDQPLAFLDILDYREFAQYDQGDADANNTRSGQEAFDLYSTNTNMVSFPLGVRTAAEFEVLFVINGPETGWEKVRLDIFPSHAAFEAMTSNATWESAVHHREAGLNKTHGFITSPISLNKFTDGGVSDDSEGCFICGVGSSVVNPAEIIVMPDGQSMPCSQLETAATTGLIPSTACTLISSLAASCCSAN